jgi:hypothetical protein
MPITVAALRFKQEDRAFPTWRARAEFPNGYTVSVITGPGDIPNWRPGVFEAALMNADGIAEITRGDEATIDRLLEAAEALPAGLSTADLKRRMNDLE